MGRRGPKRAMPLVRAEPPHRRGAATSVNGYEKTSVGEGYADDRLRVPSVRGNAAVTFRDREYDSLASTAVRPSVGVRRSASKLRSYELAVIASDVGDAVRSAGGWMCDRVRAGWRVTALIPAESDISPLQILGVRALPFENVYWALRDSSPAAVAAASEVVEYDNRLRQDIQRLLLRGKTEVTFWGESFPPDVDGWIGEVRHRLSGAARAFKTQALITTSSTNAVAGPAETFRSVGMWYPPNCADLTPISDECG
jgi:hypothetical protein